MTHDTEREREVTDIVRRFQDRLDALVAERDALRKNLEHLLYEPRHAFQPCPGGCVTP